MAGGAVGELTLLLLPLLGPATAADDVASIRDDIIDAADELAGDSTELLLAMAVVVEVVDP